MDNQSHTGADNTETGLILNDWELWLYIAGQSPNCLKAHRNLKNFCEQYIAGLYRITLVDLAENPKLAAEHNIVAIPTLIRKKPEPFKKIVGNLANKERLLEGLGIESEESSKI